MNFDDLDKIDARIENGGWVGNLPNLPAAIRVQVRSLANPDFQRLRGEVVKDLKDGERMSPEQEAYVLRQGLLLGWSGLDVDFSAEAAGEALKRKVFRDGVWYASQVVATQGKDSLEAITGN
jgi:hypothetical protein